MKYLLDTNVCVELIRHKSPHLLRRLSQHAISEVGVSSITAAELQFGVHRSSQPARNQLALEQFLIPLAILDFDFESAGVYGPFRAHLEAQGTPIGSLDMLIAAQALSHELVLVTNNTREFARVAGLVVEDWSTNSGL